MAGDDSQNELFVELFGKDYAVELALCKSDENDQRRVYTDNQQRSFYLYISEKNGEVARISVSAPHPNSNMTRTWVTLNVPYGEDEVFNRQMFVGALARFFHDYNRGKYTGGAPAKSKRKVMGYA